MPIGPMQTLGGNNGDRAHFEHRSRNPACSLGDGRAFNDQSSAISCGVSDREPMMQFFEVIVDQIERLTLESHEGPERARQVTMTPARLERRCGWR